MKQSKQTKNKHLRQLVRNYEIEKNRPRGVKLLDKIERSIPAYFRKDYGVIFVAPNVFNELGDVREYNNKNIIKVNGLRKSIAIFARDLETITEVKQNKKCFE
jgi:hypothetical protein